MEKYGLVDTDGTILVMPMICPEWSRIPNETHPNARWLPFVEDIDFESLPFQIPLGALIPVRMENLLPANKNIGTTHITNGCYRLHPVEWNIGESAGLLVAFALNKKLIPRKVREKRELLEEFQNFITEQGIETHWPER